MPSAGGTRSMPTSPCEQTGVGVSLVGTRRGGARQPRLTLKTLSPSNTSRPRQTATRLPRPRSGNHRAREWCHRFSSVAPRPPWRPQETPLHGQRHSELDSCLEIRKCACDTGVDMVVDVRGRIVTRYGRDARDADVETRGQPGVGVSVEGTRWVSVKVGMALTFTIA